MAEYQFDHADAPETWQSLDPFTRAYITALFWTLTDDDGDSCDHLGLGDLAPEALVQITADCQAWQAAQAELLAQAGDADQNGHDYWLTRNRHGAGFWDRGYPEAIGDRLTTAAHAAGEVTAYIGDDGKVWVA